MHVFSPLLCDQTLQITRSAALASFKYVGLGDRHQADQAAVNAMREVFRNTPIKGKVVIGEGERDTAPMLYIGEKVGMWQGDQPECDIAVDPLEGTNLCAKALGGALSVLALSEKGSLFNAPDIYMEKIACGPKAKEVIDLKSSVEVNLKKISEALNKKISEMTVAILDRPRHKKVIQSVYDMGARVHLMEDGDLSASILTSWSSERESMSIDLMLGTGGAPEGVLSASALKCLGGGFQGRLVFQNEEQKKRASQMGITDYDKVYEIEDLVKSSVIFCATGVTSGALLKGVTQKGKCMETESLYMNSSESNIQFIKTIDINK